MKKQKKRVASKKDTPKKKTIKSKKPTRVKTGITGFDKLVEGGFEYGSVNLVKGGSGTGKTIFAMQFLMEGLKRKENVLYITFEETKKDFYKNMIEFGWNLQKIEATGKFTFLEYSPEKIKMMLDEGGGVVESIVLKKKIKRIIIDSLSSFSLLFQNLQERRQNISTLFDMLKKWDCTVLVTFQADSKNKQADSIAEIQADSSILFSSEKLKGKRQKTLEVLKMRGTDHSENTHAFDFSKKGITMGRKIRKSK